jgi:hypothetical protein
MWRLYASAVACAVLLLVSSVASAWTSEKGLYSVEMKIEEGELKKGKNIVEVLVLDKEGKAVEGAELKFTPWMPGMGHGTPWETKVTELGGGSYRTNVPLTMGGHWEIRIDIKEGGNEDRVVLDFPSVKE